MTPRRATRAALTAAGLAMGLSCATSPPVADVAPPCLGLAPPRILAANLVALPATFAAAHVGAEMPVEVTVGPDGTVGEVAVRTSDLALLAPFAEESLKRSRFAPGAFEGNPVAVRVPVRVSVGAPPGRPANEEGLAQVWAYVAAGESREARWQLRDSVSRLTLVARLGRSESSGATIVGVAPGGAQKTLLTLPATASPQQIHQTVATGKFFAPAGNYRLELRTAGGAIASAHLTIADDSTRAVVNACEPLSVSRKTGPGK